MTILTIAIFSLIVFVLLISTLRVPSTALSSVICMFAIEQWVQGNSVFFVQNSSLVNLIIGVLVVIAVVAGFFRGARLFDRYPSVAWVTVILFFYALVSLGWVTRQDIALAKWNERAPYVITVLLLAPLLVSRIEDFRRVFLSTLLLGALMTFLLLFTVKWEYRFVVLAGSSHFNSYGNPLAPATMAGNVICIALLYRFQKGSLILTVFRWLLAASCLFLILKSGSRGQFVAALLALLIGWPLSRRARGLAGFSSFMGVGAITFGAIWFLNIFLSGELGEDDRAFLAQAMKNRWSEDAMLESIGGRLAQTGQLLSFWLQSSVSIVFGLGNSASYDPDLLGIYPHFVPGEILAEEGIIGLILYFCILLLSIKNIRNTYKAVKHNEQQRGMLAIIVSVLTYSFVLSLKQGSMLGNLSFFLWVMLLGRFERSVIAVPKQVDAKRVTCAITSVSNNSATQIVQR